MLLKSHTQDEDIAEGILILSEPKIPPTHPLL